MKLDIEAEGFKFSYTENEGSYGALPVYEKDYENHPLGLDNQKIQIRYDEKDSNWVHIMRGDNETTLEDWEVMFIGQIPTQEDFKKVMSMVVIQALASSPKP